MTDRLGQIRQRNIVRVVGIGKCGLHARWPAIVAAAIEEKLREIQIFLFAGHAAELDQGEFDFLVAG